MTTFTKQRFALAILFATLMILSSLGCMAQGRANTRTSLDGSESADVL